MPSRDTSPICPHETDGTGLHVTSSKNCSKTDPDLTSMMTWTVLFLQRPVQTSLSFLVGSVPDLAQTTTLGK